MQTTHPEVPHELVTEIRLAPRWKTDLIISLFTIVDYKYFFLTPNQSAVNNPRSFTASRTGCMHGVRCVQVQAGRRSTGGVLRRPVLDAVEAAHVRLHGRGAGAPGGGRECRREYPDAYVRLIAFDSSRQCHSACPSSSTSPPPNSHAPAACTGFD